jgi:release factor glutamine methyltransferase
MDFKELPEAYKKGYTDFLGTRIDLSKRPLIPREETEYWVALAIEEIKKRIDLSKRPMTCLDLFSGSGCVGIAVLSKVSETRFDFGEIADDFLDQIRINLDLNRIDSARYAIVKSDVFSAIIGKYDFILANPPYVATARTDEIGEDVKAYEPMIALLAGTEGMDLIKTFLDGASDHLEEKGVVYMEMDPQQKEAVSRIMDESVENKKYSSYEFLNDQFGRTRVLKIIK